MDEQYLALRGRFTDLCLFNLPDRLREERKREAPGEFDRLCTDPRLDCLAVQTPFLWLGTKYLAMEAPYAQFHWVGNFAVRINVATKEITCVGDHVQKNENLSAWHPHVRVDTGPCFGAGVDKLTTWFGDGKYAHIGLYVLEFLCLARGDNHYMPPHLWPQLTPEEVIEWKKLRP